jgi:tetratricopeptide (TPR) repeat protein
VRRKAVLGAAHPDTLESMTVWGVANWGKLERALPLHEEAVQLAKDNLGPTHPVTLSCMNGLEQAYKRAKMLEQARPLVEEIYMLQMAAKGPEHPDTLSALYNLAGWYARANKLDAAVPLLEQALKGMTAKLGPSHPDTRSCVTNLAGKYQAQGRYDRAVDLLAEQLNRLKTEQPPQSESSLLAAMHELADAYCEAGRPEQAVPLYEEEIRLHTAKPGADKNVVASQARNDLGLALLQQRKYAQAEPLLRGALTAREKSMNPRSMWLGNTRSALGEALAGQGKYPEAEPLLRTGYEILAAATIPARYRNRLTQAVDRLVQLYDAWGQRDKADEWRKKLEETEATARPAAKP